MADLSLAFSDLYNEVLKFLGTYNSGAPASGDTTDAKFIVNRAYARFVSYFDWTFLTQRRTIETNANQWIYELPSEFGYLVYPYWYYSDDDTYPKITQRTPGQIQEYRADNAYSNFPIYFALQAGNYNQFTGQSWELVLYPTPDSTYRLWSFMKINPQKLVNDTDIPIGGADMSDCLLQLCLAYAEEYKDERKAVHSETVNTILGPAKMMDNRRRTSNLGYMGPAPIVDIGEDRHSGDVIVSS